MKIRIAITLLMIGLVVYGLNWYFYHSETAKFRLNLIRTHQLHNAFNVSFIKESFHHRDDYLITIDLSQGTYCLEVEHTKQCEKHFDPFFSKQRLIEYSVIQFNPKDRNHSYFIDNMKLIEVEEEKFAFIVDAVKQYSPLFINSFKKIFSNDVLNIHATNSLSSLDEHFGIKETIYLDRYLSVSDDVMTSTCDISATSNPSGSKITISDSLFSGVSLSNGREKCHVIKFLPITLEKTAQGWAVYGPYISELLVHSKQEVTAFLEPIPKGIIEDKRVTLELLQTQAEKKMHSDWVVN